jgi:2-methylcitrate dehydratase
VIGRFDWPLPEDAHMITQTHVKTLPVCYHGQSAVLAALDLRSRAPVQDIDEIQVHAFRTAGDMMGNDPSRWAPATRETADHSLPYITAIALIDGKVTDQQFQPSRFTDPAIWKFLENVKVTRNAELSSLYPGAVANIVHVTLKDGRTLTKRVDYPLGNAKNPVSDVELERKFLHLVAPALGRDHSAKILDQAWTLDQQSGVHHLMKLLRMP